MYTINIALALPGALYAMIIRWCTSKDLRGQPHCFRISGLNYSTTDIKKHQGRGRAPEHALKPTFSMFWRKKTSRACSVSCEVINPQALHISMVGSDMGLTKGSTGHCSGNCGSAKISVKARKSDLGGEKCPTWCKSSPMSWWMRSWLVGMCKHM